MRNGVIASVFMVVFNFTCSSPSLANGAGTSSGLTLLEPSSARAASLGEAFSAMSKDVSAMTYNPASLGTLQSGQASFMYQKGMMEDTFGQLLFGAPTAKGGWGLLLGYYTAGTMDISYDGITSQSVNAQKDMTVTFGVGRSYGRASLGLNVKYLSSELIEKEKARAYAIDLGFSSPVNSRLRVGTALQNIGTQLKYAEEGNKLPRVARVGASLDLLTGHRPLTLLLDVPYFMNETELRPAAGLELGIGALALRAGYRKLDQVNEFSMGTGFVLGRFSIDYSFGLVQDLDSQQRVNLSMKFGGQNQSAGFSENKNEKKKAVKSNPRSEKVTPAVVKPVAAKPVPPIKSHTLSSLDEKTDSRRAARVYLVKPGDTLAKISVKFYGRIDMWRSIYNANRHLIDDPSNLKPGQKILIP